MNFEDIWDREIIKKRPMPEGIKEEIEFMDHAEAIKVVSIIFCKMTAEAIYDYQEERIIELERIIDNYSNLEQ